MQQPCQYKHSQMRLRSLGYAATNGFPTKYEVRQLAEINHEMQMNATENTVCT